MVLDGGRAVAALRSGLDDLAELFEEAVGSVHHDVVRNALRVVGDERGCRVALGVVRAANLGQAARGGYE